jgi:broad specificity phosphatase PhoE
MSVKITYFVHGTTTDNEKDLATGWLPGKLSEKGREQSKGLPGLIEGIHFDAIFSSDLERAVESAELAFPGVGIIQDSRLRECNYGDLNGTPAAAFKAHLTDYIDCPFPHGESYRDVEKRLLSFLDHLRQDYHGKHIAIVAHQGPQLALDVILAHKSWPQAIATDWRNTKAWQPGWLYEA